MVVTFLSTFLPLELSLKYQKFQNLYRGIPFFQIILYSRWQCLEFFYLYSTNGILVKIISIDPSANSTLANINYLIPSRKSTLIYQFVNYFPLICQCTSAAFFIRSCIKHINLENFHNTALRIEAKKELENKTCSLENHSNKLRLGFAVNLKI